MAETIDVRLDSNQQLTLSDDKVIDLDAMRAFVPVPATRIPATPGLPDSSYYLG